MANLGQTGQNRAQNQVFCQFSQVWCTSFSLNCMGDSLEKCLTTSFVKNIYWPEFGLNGPNISFLPYIKVCTISFP